MDYEFSIPWFVVGLIITALGGLFIKYHMFVADNFGGGAGSYDRYKLAALIMVGVGLVAMINLHTLLLGLIFGSLFDGIRNG
ncbi:MAG: hypothetical protein UW38_C0001G0931 [Candidatus Saccharibacteria bacterium GW2011_GWC2_44_17]|nr:MAG: hypothetical protein UW38_C0001G0931 [Candidatus Saccharibacteria bacterium GW2011_GWC2_44_17]MBH1956657.1 hypothetical protein [Candidatus Saccharibacteria bacterium]MBH1973045.1 hypothetical protein [Candidatus Saccharibacteria bacterium]